MNQLVFTYKGSQISYYRSGSGLQPVICFHGYGETGEGFTFLSAYTGSEFTFYSIELPFHGSTDWKEGLLFSPLDLITITTNITSSHQSSQSQQPISLIGFSLGARVALSLYQHQPSIIKKIVLLAPDGLKVNFWYWFATQTWFGNKFFLLTMRRPAWFLGLLRIFNKLKLVNASIYKFVTYYINDEEVRRLLYDRWTTLRKLRPSTNKIKSLIKVHKTPVRLIYGKHDRIILSSVGERFVTGIEEYATTKMINSGHQVLHEKHADEILQALRH